MTKVALSRASGVAIKVQVPYISFFLCSDLKGITCMNEITVVCVTAPIVTDNITF